MRDDIRARIRWHKVQHTRPHTTEDAELFVRGAERCDDEDRISRNIDALRGSAVRRDHPSIFRAREHRGCLHTSERFVLPIDLHRQELPGRADFDALLLHNPTDLHSNRGLFGRRHGSINDLLARRRRDGRLRTVPCNCAGSTRLRSTTERAACAARSSAAESAALCGLRALRGLAAREKRPRSSERGDTQKRAA